MAYGRKTIPPPATPFEEFMATASEKMIAAKLDFIEFLRELEGRGRLREARRRRAAGLDEGHRPGCGTYEGQSC